MVLSLKVLEVMRSNTRYIDPLFCSCVVTEEMWIEGTHSSYPLKSPYEGQVLGYDIRASDDVCILILLERYVE